FSVLLPPLPRSTLFPYTTLFRSPCRLGCAVRGLCPNERRWLWIPAFAGTTKEFESVIARSGLSAVAQRAKAEATKQGILALRREDRKSTRLNSSHVAISYAVFCL